jgi:hypothetical protein
MSDILNWTDSETVSEELRDAIEGKLPGLRPEITPFRAVLGKPTCYCSYITIRAAASFAYDKYETDPPLQQRAEEACLDLIEMLIEKIAPLANPVMLIESSPQLIEYIDQLVAAGHNPHSRHRGTDDNSRS